MIKIGSIELTETEAEALYTTGKKYLVAYTRIYVIEYSRNAGYHGRVIYRSPNKGENFTRRGRFFAYTASQVNHLLEFNLLNT